MQILENVFDPRNVNIMLDIETTGTSPGCRVLSIGLAYFTNHDVEETSYILPSLEKQFGTDNFETMQWWEQQSDEAKRVFAENIIRGVSIECAAKQMSTFIDSCIRLHKDKFPDIDKPKVCLWGNSSTFDNAILAQMFRDNGVNDIPWNTYGDRCYRTITNVLGKVTPNADRGVYHNAVDDAVYQALTLIVTLERCAQIGNQQ